MCRGDNMGVRCYIASFFLRCLEQDYSVFVRVILDVLSSKTTPSV